MLKNLLEKAKVEVKKEMDRVGFIDDSDNIDRFLDNLANKLAEEDILKGNNDIEFYYEKEDEIRELKEKLLQQIKDEVMSNYSMFSTLENGQFAGCYYNTDKEFENWEEFNKYYEIGE